MKFSNLLAWILPFAKNRNDHYPSLLDATFEDIQLLLDQRSVTSLDIVNVYLERISNVNDELKAIIEINPDAQRIAKELDVERSLGNVRGPLHGIPIIVKDNIATKDLMNNTAGSTCLIGARVSDEATVVTRLRQAGAVILGKANMSEWAAWRSIFNSTTMGWSAYGGQTRGAYREDQDSGGSSSGTGVAVSVGLAAAGLGTETSGSVIIPAEWNNVVGVKPTLGLVSRHMVIPINPRQDVVGPMARTVRDAASLLSVMASKDINDNYTMAQPFDQAPDYVKALNYSALEGARIGIPWNGISLELYASGSHEHFEMIMKAFNSSIVLLEAAGATVISTSFRSGSIQPPWIKRHPYFDADFIPSMNHYLKYLDPKTTKIRTFDDIVNCTINDPREQYPTRDILRWKAALASEISPSSSEAWESYQHVYRHSGPDGVFGALAEHNLDALLLPSCLSYILPAYAGSPVVTVPMGVFGDEVSTVWRKEEDPAMRSVVAGPGMPFGLSFLGAKWSEETLLGLAYAYEQRTMVRRKIKPLVVPRAELGVSRPWHETEL